MQSKKGLLILTRCKGEAIVLTLANDRQVTVKVVETRSGGRVVLGVDAPPDVTVNREERQVKEA